ncbi:MAG: asparaginase [Boseongicola sp.]
MLNAVPMAEVTRGGFVESIHLGHAVIARADGRIVESWGNPDIVTLPRSSAKMIQALPLLESGAGADLSSEHLALACASHSGERRHVDRVSRWLLDIGLDDTALKCGPQTSRDAALANEMIRADAPVTRLFNNCSGKHTGFLALAKHQGADLNYVDPDHPVQLAVREAFEVVTDALSPGFGIDGCSAPNFATTLTGLARAMAVFAEAREDGPVRMRAAARLRNAMMAHPELVAGKDRAGSNLMSAATDPVVIKSGAEGVYVAVLPNQGLGVALKIADGASRASEAAIAAMLVRLGVLDARHPMVSRYLDCPILNRDGLVTGAVRPVSELFASGFSPDEVFPRIALQK